MAQTKLGGGRNRGKSSEEGGIGSETREKGDLPSCSTPLFLYIKSKETNKSKNTNPEMQFQSQKLSMLKLHFYLPRKL